MERVRITKCDLIMNGAAHGVTLADGRQCTAWNDKIEAGILMQHLNQEISLEIKPYTSKAGKAGFNIVGIGETTNTMDYTGGTNGVSQNTNPGVPVASPPVQAPGLPSHAQGSVRDNSIVSQVFIKCVSRIMLPRLTDKTTISEAESIGQNSLKLIYDLYKQGIGLLENGE